MKNAAKNSIASKRIASFAALIFLMSLCFLIDIKAQPPCNGMPQVGNINAFQNPVCPGVSFGMIYNPTQSGITFQWFSSSDGTNFFPIAGATQQQIFTSILQPTYFRIRVTCTQSGMSASSNPLLITLIQPVIQYPAANVTLTNGESTHPDNTGYVTFSSECCQGSVTYSDTRTSDCCQIFITRTWRIVDCYGYLTTYVQTITVLLDVSAPVITCAALRPGACNTTPSPDPGSVTVTDECPGSLTVTSSDAAGAGCIVVTTFTWTATDQCGHSSTCTQTYSRIMDAVPPVIVCPPPVALPCNTTPTPSASLITATDNCGTPEISLVSSSSSTVGCLVTYVFTWRAIDACGNFADCKQILTSIHDEIAPVINCPEPVSLPCNTVPIPDASLISATDNCGIPVISYLGTSSSTAGCLITFVFTWRATDDCGNFADCNQILESVFDEIAPVITCPEPVTLPCNTIPFPSAALITATDNCGPPDITLQGTDISPFFACTTRFVFTWRATDVCGNFAECDQVFYSVIDLIPPVIKCPAPDTLCNVTPTPSAALISATDNCGPADITYLGTTTSTTGCVTTYNFTWKATDLCGNFSTCVQVIYVINDQIDPVINDCPNTQSVANEEGLCGAHVSWTPPTATDNCGLRSFTSTHAPNSFFLVGTTTVTYTAIDICGHVTTCTFNILVEDLEPPWNMHCPGVIIQDNDPGLCSAVVTWTVMASDNCEVKSIKSNPESGSVFAVGVTPVLVTATDIHGNTWTCAFNVHVNDKEKPVFVFCPPNILLNTDPGKCTTFFLTPILHATDNCEVLSVVETTPANIFFPVGITLVRYRATDIYGNFQICSFNVIVTDNQFPVIHNCPANIRVNNDATLCKAKVTWIEPTADDNCAILSFTRSHNPGDDFPVGVTTVTYTATDVNGNITICTFNVRVDDVEEPFILSDDIVTCDSIVFFNFVIGDNCGIDVYSYSPHSGSVFPVGTTLVYVEAFDIHGNFNSEYFNVIVLAPPSVIDTVISSGSEICLGDSITLTAYFDTLGAGGVIKLYKDFCSEDFVVDSSSVVDSAWSIKVKPSVTGIVTYYFRIEGICDTTECYPVSFTINPCPVKLTLKVFIEGFYTGGGLMDNSGAGGCLFKTGVSLNSFDADSIFISAMNSTSPYAEVDRQPGILKTNGYVTVTFGPAVVAYSSYYLKINHRNSVETWSKAPVMLTPLTTYLFSYAATQAFGDNEVATFDNLGFAIYSGDINQDGATDASDFLELDPSIQNGDGGYAVGDLNGDGSVDASDFLVLDPNIQNGIGAVTP